MGQFQSALESIQDDPQFATRFELGEIELLARAFRRLDTDNSGTLEMEELLNLPEWKSNPLAGRIMAIFDSDDNGKVDFKEFLATLSIFSRRADDQKRMEILFQVYDVDRDGKISNGELFMVMKTMIGTNLDDEELQQAVDKTIAYYDHDNDLSLSFPEFCECLKARGLEKFAQLSIDVPRGKGSTAAAPASSAATGGGGGGAARR